MPDLNPAHHKTAKLSVYLTKSMTRNFAKKLPILGMRYEAITTRNSPYPRGYYPTYPTLPKESTHH